MKISKKRNSFAHAFTTQGKTQSLRDLTADLNSFLANFKEDFDTVYQFFIKEKTRIEMDQASSTIKNIIRRR